MVSLGPFSVLLCIGVLLIGCASNPILSGKPQDWKGKPSGDMRAALGEPTEVVPQADGSEIWIYRKTGEFLAPAQDRTNFRMGGGGGSGVFGAGGGINTSKRSEQVTDYENLWRFQIKNGKVRRWYAQRYEGGQLVWEDH
jgi:hypothetical protein